MRSSVLILKGSISHTEGSIGARQRSVEVAQGTKRGRDRILGSITKEDGRAADEDQDKRQVMADISFPPPNEYDYEEDEELPGPLDTIF